jgi:hypothetical protein
MPAESATWSAMAATRGRRNRRVGGRMRKWRRAGRCGDILRVVAEEFAGASCHRAARRARDHPYLVRQLQMVRFEQPTGVLIPVFYLFGGEESKAKNSKVAHEYAEHREHASLYWFGPPESNTLRTVVGVDCLRIGRGDVTRGRLVRLILASG